MTVAAELRLPVVIDGLPPGPTGPQGEPGASGSAVGTPLTHGGATGDGVTDDTVAAQATLSAAPSGSVVSVPAHHTFLVSGLTVPVGVTLLFESRAGVVKLKAGSVLPVVTLLAGARCVGGYIDGNRPQVSSSQARGILLVGDGARVEGTEVANVYSYGIQITDSSDAYVDAYVHHTGDIGIFADCLTRDCKRLKIRGRVDREAEGTGIVGGGVQVYGTTFKYSNVDIDCDVVLPVSPADANACCVVVNGRRGALVKGTTEGGQMGVTCDNTLDARVSSHVLGASLYGIEFSNCQDFIADAPLVDCNGLTGGGGIVANRGASGAINGPVIKFPAAGAACISVHSSSDVGISNPRLSADRQLPFVALFGSSHCSVVGGVLRDTSGLCNGLLIDASIADASHNVMTGTALRGLGTVLRILSHTAGRHADRNMVAAVSVVGTGPTKGAFLQAANGGTVDGTRLGDSSLVGVGTKVQSLGATGTAAAAAWM